MSLFRHGEEKKVYGYKPLFALRPWRYALSSLRHDDLANMLCLLHVTKCLYHLVAIKHLHGQWFQAAIIHSRQDFAEQEFDQSGILQRDGREINNVIFADALEIIHLLARPNSLPADLQKPPVVFQHGKAGGN